MTEQDDMAIKSKHSTASMRSAQMKGYGNSEVVEITRNTVPLNDPSAGKVLVKVKAAGVNPADWKIREGGLQHLVKLQFPSTMGMDFSGIVVKVGDSVSDLKPGDEVYGQAGIISGGSGAFADMALADADRIAPKPKTLTHQEAAGLPLVGVSAWQALVENIGLTGGQKILIHGGAGGIGSIAIQLAKHLGAYVATTVRANDMQFVKELGADVIIDYQTQNFDEVVKDFDAVYDNVGGETYARSFKVLRRGGIIVSMLEQPNQQLMDQYDVKAMFQFTQVNRERLTKLARWVEQNNIHVNIDRTFSLEETAEALEYQKMVHPRGKVVLEIERSQTNVGGAPNIVLVHGAWADGSSWSNEIPILEKVGLKVIAVQLPLHSLADDVATVKRAVELLGGPTILVGHSYGGFVITNAAYNNPNVSGLVYVAAFAPDEGESLGNFVDITKLPKDFLIIDSAGFAYINPTFFPQSFAQDVKPTEARILSAVQKPINASILQEKSGPPAWKQLPTWYQVSEQDRMIPPDAERKFAQRMNATTVSLDSSHASLVSQPDKIAELILDAAKVSNVELKKVVQ